MSESSKPPTLSLGAYPSDEGGLFGAEKRLWEIAKETKNESLKSLLARQSLTTEKENIIQVRGVRK